MDYVDSGVVPFHTPGHMQGHGMDPAFREFVGDNVLAIDLTQIRGLDDLLQPTEAIAESTISLLLRPGRVRTAAMPPRYTSRIKT